MRKEYLIPEIDISFTAEDIITASPVGYHTVNDPYKLPDLQPESHSAGGSFDFPEIGA